LLTNSPHGRADPGLTWPPATAPSVQATGLPEGTGGTSTMPYDVSATACRTTASYLLHTGATGVLGNVMRVATRRYQGPWSATTPLRHRPQPPACLMRPASILLPPAAVRTRSDPAEAAEACNREPSPIQPAGLPSWRPAVAPWGWWGVCRSLGQVRHLSGRPRPCLPPPPSAPCPL